MKKIIISVSALFAFAAALMGQNLDPTVEVSRVYEGKLVDVHKPAIEMAVPDTMYKFDLDFDYWVFDNPYKGSYEFKPYVMEMRPSSIQKHKNTFFLQAGAGYTLHPMLDLLWAPLKDGAFSMDVFATHRSYIGDYRALEQIPAWEGYDLLSKAGVDFGYDWKKADIEFGASYYGIADKDYRRARMYNAVDAYASLNSKSAKSNGFIYGLDLAYRFAEDAAVEKMNEHVLGLDACLGSGLKNGSKVLVDFGMDMNSYSGALESAAARFFVVPHYVLSKGILGLDLGVRLSAIATNGTAFVNKGQIVYPDVRIDLALVPDAMKMYLHVGGGDKLQTYSSLIDKNHHLDLSYGLAGAGSLMGVTVEKLAAVLGIKGRISSRFSYNLRGGFVDYKSAPLDAVGSAFCQYVPMLGYSPYQKAFVALDWNMAFQSVRFDGSVAYNNVWGIENVNFIGLSAVEGDVAFAYDWNSRINAGVDCNFATARSSAAGFRVPGYADLGVYGEYALNRKISFWLRGGNLLNMEIQRNLLFAEKGINFTAGICLNL